MKAIPTAYAGVRFRSRLEARWAAFFDLAGIEWEYEPIDFDGWTPDFLLRTPVAPVYAEVKPVELRPLDLGPGGAALLRLAVAAGLKAFMLSGDHPSFDKARRHGRSVQVLLLGAEPQTHAHVQGIGELLQKSAGARYRRRDIRPTFEVVDERRLWREAGNLVQWRGAA